MWHCVLQIRRQYKISKLVKKIASLFACVTASIHCVQDYFRIKVHKAEVFQHYYRHLRIPSIDVFADLYPFCSMCKCLTMLMMLASQWNFPLFCMLFSFDSTYLSAESYCHFSSGEFGFIQRQANCLYQNVFTIGQINFTLLG